MGGTPWPPVVAYITDGRQPSVSNQTIAGDRYRILPVMTSTTLPVVLRRLRHNQRYLNRVAQSDQSIRELCSSIKRLDLIPKVTQLTNGTRQPIRASNQPHVVPHDVLNRLHVALNQRRVG